MKRTIKTGIFKKAQFYLFIALILCFVAFFVVLSKNNIMQPEKYFEYLSNNYIDEVPIVVNAAIYNGEDVFKGFDNYTKYFIAYAKVQEPLFELIGILAHNGQIYVSNEFLSNISAVYGNFNYSISSGSSQLILKNGTERLNIYTNRTRYSFYMANQEEMKALFRINKNRNIYVRKYG